MASSLVSPLRANLQRLAVLCLSLVLCFGLVACDGSQGRKPPTISADDLATIQRQAEGFLSARDRLPELATLVNERNWVFTRNLIHGPMQEVGREMLYINQRLLPADRAEANERADNLKTALAQLDEAARLQDGERLRKAYIQVARDFGLYAQVLPPQVQDALKQS
jgi:photosystem II protein PsbQ